MRLEKMNLNDNVADIASAAAFIRKARGIRAKPDAFDGLFDVSSCVRVLFLHAVRIGDRHVYDRMCFHPAFLFGNGKVVEDGRFHRRRVFGAQRVGLVVGLLCGVKKCAERVGQGKGKERERERERDRTRAQNTSSSSSSSSSSSPNSMCTSKGRREAPSYLKNALGFVKPDVQGESIRGSKKQRRRRRDERQHRDKDSATDEEHDDERTNERRLCRLYWMVVMF